MLAHTMCSCQLSSPILALRQGTSTFENVKRTPELRVRARKNDQRATRPVGARALLGLEGAKKPVYSGRFGAWSVDDNDIKEVRNLPPGAML
jgi:hypothetical protein